MHTNRALTRPLCWLLMLVSLAASSHPQFTGPEFPKPPKVNMTADRQRALGLEAAAEVYKQMPVLPDRSPQTQYIRQLGQKLVATIPPAYSWPFEFHVIPQKEINAFALPGGPMFINIGTMTGASNEAELAGVMAHEMAHVYMQHSAKQMGKTQNTTLWAGLASAVLGATTGGFIGQLAQMGVQFTANGTTNPKLTPSARSFFTKRDTIPKPWLTFFKSWERKADSQPSSSVIIPTQATASRQSKKRYVSGHPRTTRLIPAPFAESKNNLGPSAPIPLRKSRKEPSPANGLR